LQLLNLENRRKNLERKTNRSIQEEMNGTHKINALIAFRNQMVKLKQPEEIVLKEIAIMCSLDVRKIFALVDDTAIDSKLKLFDYLIDKNPKVLKVDLIFENCTNIKIE
jgi:hypothetical protein